MAGSSASNRGPGRPVDGGLPGGPAAVGGRRARRHSDPDFAALVDRLRRDHDVELVEAPAIARRVGSPDDVRLLEALTTPQV